MEANNIRYIIKDSLNTYINMVNTLDEVHLILKSISKKLNDTYSVYGGSLDGNPVYEDNAVFRIPQDMKQFFKNKEYIHIYFFKFDINENKLVELY